MVKVPTPSFQGGAELGNVQPIASREAHAPDMVSGVIAAWRPWAEIAGGVAELGAQLQKQDNEKNLLEIQNATSEWEREKMFGEGGWASQDGQGAFGLTDRADEEWRNFQSSLLEGRNINGATRKAAEQYLDGRRNDTLTKIAGSEFKHREAYAVNELQTGADNEVALAASYWSSPSDVAKHTSLALQKLDQIHQRQGIALDSEQANKAEKALMGDITKGVFTNMRTEDPVQALAYLNGAEAAGNIDGITAGVLRAQVTDEAKTYYGETIGRNAYSGLNQSGTVGALSSSNINDFMIGTVEHPGALIDVEGAYKVGKAKGISPGQVMSPTNDLGVAQLNVSIRNPSNPSLRGSFGFGVKIDVDRYESGDVEYQHQAARDMFNALYTHPRSPTQGNWVLTALAYNAGHARVGAWIKNGMPLDGPGALDPITEKYISKITKGAVDLEKLGAERAVAMGKAADDPAGIPSAGVSLQVPDEKAKAGGPQAEFAMLEELLKIPDPKVRESAIQSFLQLGRQRAAMEAQVREQMQGDAYSWLDAGKGSLDDFIGANPGARDILGQSLPGLREYEKREKYIDPTDGEILFQDRMANPKAFAAMTREQFESTFRPMFGSTYYVKKREMWTALRVEQQAAQLASEADHAKLMQEASVGQGKLALTPTDSGAAVKGAFSRMGNGVLNTKNKSAVAGMAQAEARVIQAHGDFVEKNGRAMTPIELMATAEREMLNGINVNPAGWNLRNSSVTAEQLTEQLQAAALSGGIIDGEDFDEISIPVRNQTSGGAIEGASVTLKPDQVYAFIQNYRSDHPGATMRQATQGLLAMYGWGVDPLAKAGGQ